MAPMDAAKISELVSNADSWAKVQLQFGWVRKQDEPAYNIYKIVIREFEELYVIHILRKCGINNSLNYFFYPNEKKTTNQNANHIETVF